MIIFTLDIIDVFLKIKAFAIQKYTHTEYLLINMQPLCNLGLSVLDNEYEQVLSFFFVPYFSFVCFYSLIPFTSVRKELMAAPP